VPSRSRRLLKYVHEVAGSSAAYDWQVCCRCPTLRAFHRHQETASMYAILRGANGRRHEVDFGDDPVVVEVSMSDITVQITMTAPGDLDPDRARFVTVTVPREQLVAAMAEAVNRRSKPGGVTGIRLVGEGS
jgi:hypothetical protein